MFVCKTAHLRTPCVIVWGATKSTGKLRNEVTSWNESSFQSASPLDELRVRAASVWRNVLAHRQAFVFLVIKHGLISLKINAEVRIKSQMGELNVIYCSPKFPSDHFCMQRWLMSTCAATFLTRKCLSCVNAWYFVSLKNLVLYFYLQCNYLQIFVWVVTGITANMCNNNPTVVPCNSWSM